MLYLINETYSLEAQAPDISIQSVKLQLHNFNCLTCVSNISFMHVFLFINLSSSSKSKSEYYVSPDR